MRDNTATTAAATIRNVYILAQLPLQQFVGKHMANFCCVGTPAQLTAFLESVKRGEVRQHYVARFCFDLDRALLTSSSDGKFEGRQGVHPLRNNIQLLQVCPVGTGGGAVINEKTRNLVLPSSR